MSLTTDVDTPGGHGAAHQGASRGRRAIQGVIWELPTSSH